MATTTTEVLAIGAGPSGAVASPELARAGIAVSCLEQGDYPGDRPDFELQALTPRRGGFGAEDPVPEMMLQPTRYR